MMMKMVDPHNDPSLFNADVMIVFFSMLCHRGGATPTILDVGSMFINPLVYWSSSLPNIRSSTRTRNDVNTLPILRVNRALNRMKRTLNSVKGSKRRINLMFLQDPSDFICDPLNKRKMKSRRPILGINLPLRTFFSI